MQFRLLSEVTFHKCGQKGHYSNKCTSQRRLPPPPPVRPPSNAMVKFNHKSGRVNMVNAAKVENSSDVIMGNLVVNSIPAKVLFDSGASHSFMSRIFLSEHDFDSDYLSKALRVISPDSLMSANKVVLNVSIKMGSYSFLASPIVLG